mmetsp:Transcript_5593/g.16001  ORF Transcript_5593/g.16001 Transcript_5593/m.16001 type:complete len:238 (+) Transcript_5593:2132-2845(+)
MHARHLPAALPTPRYLGSWRPPFVLRASDLEAATSWSHETSASILASSAYVSRGKFSFAADPRMNSSALSTTLAASSSLAHDPSDTSFLSLYTFACHLPATLPTPRNLGICCPLFPMCASNRKAATSSSQETSASILALSAYVSRGKFSLAAGPFLHSSALSWTAAASSSLAYVPSETTRPLLYMLACQLPEGTLRTPRNPVHFGATLGPRAASRIAAATSSHERSAPTASCFTSSA